MDKMNELEKICQDFNFQVFNSCECKKCTCKCDDCSEYVDLIKDDKHYYYSFKTKKIYFIGLVKKND